MTDEELLNNLKDRIERKLLVSDRELIVEDVIPGGNTEFGSPAMLTLRRKKFSLDITSKIGTSWYFSDNQDIRLLGIGFKYNAGQEYYNGKYCLLENTGLLDFIIWPWVEETLDKGIDVSSAINELRAIIPEIKNTHVVSKIMSMSALFPQHATVWNGMNRFCNKWYKGSWTVKAPRIRYFINNGVDDPYFSHVLDMKVPDIRDTGKEKSFILQFRRYGDILRLFITIRELSKEKYPRLLRLDPEVEVRNLEEAGEFIYKNSLEDLVQWQQVLIETGGQDKKHNEFYKKFRNELLGIEWE